MYIFPVSSSVIIYFLAMNEIAHDHYFQMSELRGSDIDEF